MLADHVIMVKPSAFHFNTQTARDNVYQSDREDLSEEEINRRAEEEFKGLLNALRAHGVHVDVVEDFSDDTPDSVFPNNTFVTFPGRLFISPMYSENRKREFPKLRAQYEELFDFDSLDVADCSKSASVLEGTGAVVIDRFHDIGYAALSNRAERDAFEAFCRRYDLEPVAFSTLHHGAPVYHTNVIMTVAEHFAMVADSLITEGRGEVLKHLEATGKEIISLTAEEIDHFAGNCLELSGEGPILVMAEEAYDHLAPEKIARIERYDAIVHVPLPIISSLGGGSARCMIAENFIDSRQ
ncbi:MAG: arginine deiminase-related protein [Peptoniphilus sp.]|nr:arginine deiminase-related protein [Peptoniphilus sp.]MDD7363211.1 arginine deiminase-related protein [Bacillota bacterium]MDY6044465.1 arginine deiminase-related protein [Peptoniphilus sp.]